MPPPIIGIGQSWGGYPITRAALIHPRLFTAIIGIEPYLIAGEKEDSGFAAGASLGMIRKKENWNSLEEARSSILKNSYFAAFDRNVFEKVMQHDFRTTADGQVTLVTPKAQELATMVRIKPEAGITSESASEYTNAVEQTVARGFYRLEPAVISHEICNLRPAALYVFGSISLVGQGLRRYVMENTGIGPLGNGGRKSNMVSDVVVEGASHPIPLEMPKEAAQAMVPWLQEQIKRWDEQLEVYSRPTEYFWTSEVNPKWKKMMLKL